MIELTGTERKEKQACLQGLKVSLDNLNKAILAYYESRTETNLDGINWAVGAYNEAVEKANRFISQIRSKDAKWQAAWKLELGKFELRPAGPRAFYGPKTQPDEIQRFKELYEAVA